MGFCESDQEMEGKRIVVDASVIAKWFLEEEYSEHALKLRNDYIEGHITIVVPSLLEYEVLNALKYSGMYSREELEKIGVSLNKYGFETYNLQGRFKGEAVRVSSEADVTIYDASYVALARTLKTKLYTADEELVKKFPKTAIHIREY